MILGGIQRGGAHLGEASRGVGPPDFVGGRDRSRARPGAIPTLAITRIRAGDTSREARQPAPHSRPPRESVNLDSMHSASYLPGLPPETPPAMLAGATPIGFQRASASRDRILKPACEGHLVRLDPAADSASVLPERTRAEREAYRPLRGRRIRRPLVHLFRTSHAPPAPHTVVS